MTYFLMQCANMVCGQDQLLGRFLIWACGPEAKFLHGRTVEANWDINELVAAQESILAGDLLKSSLRGYPLNAETWEHLCRTAASSV